MPYIEVSLSYTPTAAVPKCFDVTVHEDMERIMRMSLDWTKTPNGAVIGLVGSGVVYTPPAAEN